MPSKPPQSCWSDIIIEYKRHLITGVDEVGRGPLSGSVVAAAVIFNSERLIDGLTDSKRLSAARREALDIQNQRVRVRAGIFDSRGATTGD